MSLRLRYVRTSDGKLLKEALVSSFYAAAGQDELEGFVQRFTVLSPAEYATLLDRLGFSRTHVRLQVYPHRLSEGAAVADFLGGSLLTGYSRRLSPARYRDFFAEYRRRVGEALGTGQPYLYAFERLLFWARRDAAQQEALEDRGYTVLRLSQDTEESWRAACATFPSIFGVAR